MAIFELSNTSKKFGKIQVIEVVSLRLSTGEILGVFGRNGSGKSTLLKILFGTIKADAISLSIGGRTVKPIQIINKKLIGFLPQNTILPKSLKVREIIPIYFI